MENLLKETVNSSEINLLLAENQDYDKIEFQGEILSQTNLIEKWHKSVDK